MPEGKTDFFHVKNPVQIIIMYVVLIINEFICSYVTLVRFKVICCQYFSPFKTSGNGTVLLTSVIISSAIMEIKEHLGLTM